MVTAINSRASAGEEDEESCLVVPGSVGSVLGAETIQGTGNFHFHTRKPAHSG